MVIICSETTALPVYTFKKYWTHLCFELFVLLLQTRTLLSQVNHFLLQRVSASLREAWSAKIILDKSGRSWLKKPRKSGDLNNHASFKHFLVSLTLRGKDAEFKFKAQLVANLRGSFMQVEGYSRGLSGFSCFSYKSTSTEREGKKLIW